METHTRRLGLPVVALALVLVGVAAFVALTTDSRRKTTTAPTAGQSALSGPTSAALSAYGEKHDYTKVTAADLQTETRYGTPNTGAPRVPSSWVAVPMPDVSGSAVGFAADGPHHLVLATHAGSGWICATIETNTSDNQGSSLQYGAGRSLADVSTYASCAKRASMNGWSFSSNW